jgi:exodeoxyribonuclease VII large subunit
VRAERIGLPFDEPPEAPNAAAPAVPPRVEPAVEPPARRVRTVSELTAEIRALLETSVGEIWVEGELSNCRVWNTGHLYFTLKDASAQLKGVMFRSALRALRFRPEDGLRVVARGRISVYEPKGEYQIVCELLEPHGLGALQLAFEQLKRRLQAEGLFDAARKRPLPVLPRTIGIVTSIDGAALRDVLQVLGRRHPNLHIVIRPTRVQGEGAALEIAAALGAIGALPGVDVLIVGRGGGSIEDLWAFNEEQVARAIVASPVPVISAVGHEVDVTIADFAADVRAPTPSAAAELVVARKEEFGVQIDRLGERLRAGVRGRIERLRARTHRASARPGLAGWPARLALKGRLAAELTHDLRRVALAQTARRQRHYQDLRRHLETVDLRRRLGGVAASLDRAQRGLRDAAIRALAAAEARLGATAARLDTLSPMAVLGRGYAVCWNGDKTAIVRDAAAIGIGDAVRVTLARGELACRVETKAAD